MVVTMVVCYLLCWLPYGIMALLATFGRPSLVTPAASIVPSLLAKTSTVINPIIYIFMNKQLLLQTIACDKTGDEDLEKLTLTVIGDTSHLYVIFSLQFLPARNHGNSGIERQQKMEEYGKKECFHALVMCTTPERGSSFKNSSRVTKTLRTVRRANGHNVTFAVASAGHPTICAPNSGGQKSSSECEKPSPAVGQGTNRPVVSLVAYYNG
ncbi:Pinopsin [Anabarilius grahami]|uniref:Pinopsin n=1 Tax=Anabarilius grahami TaxID=495550 RepID=A0A3N0Y8Y3_ANAGA|nr:Pinopsin [Anabarilius grahami]